MSAIYRRTGSLIVFLLSGLIAQAKDAHPDTVKAGIYINSIHNIDFRQKEYTIDCWLWLRYDNRALDFANNLEVPQAKTVNRSFFTMDSSDGHYFIQMKLQCVMKDNWRISHFPFDKQILRLSLENSQFDVHDMVFVPDTAGKHFDPRFTLNAWKIDSCTISVSKKIYETAFGDETAKQPRTEYSSFRVLLSIERNATGIFWKMFLGMYLAFLIAYACFYIHADSMDSRFGLSVGALFAVVGNKYIVDSSLPETTSFTLVDTLHGLTLFFIFSVVGATAYSLHLVKENKLQQSRRFDMLFAQVFLVLYILLNAWFIRQAMQN
ncbi:MAG TPA: hypothetical protein VG842_06940 [Sediminibacterium sp.]|nr:hypothetical protein [Sediminibacterium sp.]